MKIKKLQLIKTKWFIAIACLILGALIVLTIRFATYKVVSVHYHANFALYTNGQHQEFKNPIYYVEAAVCSESNVLTPIGRAHMHDNVNNVVHVEDHAVTWGQFFANVGWYMGPNFIQSSDGTMYLENGNSKLHLILNNQDYTDLGGLENTVINDKDKLLVSFGDEDSSVLQKQYKAIPSTAHKYDLSKDTGACGSARNTTVHDRLTHLF